MSEIVRFAGPAELAQGAAQQFAAQAMAAIAARKRFSVALSGGSTPKALYALLGQTPFKTSIDWSRVHLFWGDERCVPPDDPQSNYLMVKTALIDHVAIPPENIHRMRGEDDPAEAAKAYEEDLRAYFGGAAPRFDLVHLGMGDDGHTASLFPGTAAVHETSRWVIAHHVAKVGMWRLTLTPVVLNAAAQVTFLVSGPSKATMLRKVLEGPRDPDHYPSQIVQPNPGRLTWFVDHAAAADLG